MLRNSAADEALSHVAIGVWENEGGALRPGHEISREKDAPPGETAAQAATTSDSRSIPPPARTWNAVVIFQRPFILDGFGDIQPAGAYSVDTQEEKLSGLPADRETWRRVDTKIRLMRQGMTEKISIDPDALLAALQRDNAQSDRSSLKNTARARLSTARRLNAFSWR
jgi:hypothetical protein